MIQGGEERFLYAAGADADADSDSDVSLHSGGDSVPQRRDFSTGLCACFEDMDSCCMTFWCPCVQQARNQHGVQGLRGRNDFVCISPLVASLLCGSCVGGCLSAYFEFNQRRALRQYHGYDQEETQCRDALIAGCCGACSTCQLAREIKNTRML